MVIIDFYGMPGSGKSTISHHLAGMLRKRNFRVIEPTWLLDMRFSSTRRILTKGFLSLLFTLTHFKLINRIFSQANNQSFLNYTEKLKMWVNVSYTMQVLNSKQNADFLIADEGLAQAVVSLYTRSSFRNFIDCFKTLRDNIRSTIEFVYIDTEMNTVLERLEKRKNGHSRVEKLDFDDRQKMLTRIREICELIAQNEDVEVVSNAGKLEDFDYEGLLHKILDRIKWDEQIYHTLG